MKTFLFLLLQQLLTISAAALQADSTSNLQHHWSNWNDSLPIYMLFASAAYCPKILLPDPVFPCGVQRSFTFTNACDADGIANSTQFFSVYQDPDTTAAAYVGRNDALKTIICAIQGTDDKELFFLDLHFWKTLLGTVQVLPNEGMVYSNNGTFGNGDPKLRVHAGFFQIWKGLRIPILNKTAELAMNPLYKDYKITFVGHSLGGAISNLALVDFAALYPKLIPRIWGVSFGSPRVGNLDYANFLARQPYADRLIRIANSGDPVIHLPPNFIGYYHGPRQYEINTTGPAIPCYDNNGKGGEGFECLRDLGRLNFTNHRNYYKLRTKC